MSGRPVPGCRLGLSPTGSAWPSAQVRMAYVAVDLDVDHYRQPFTDLNQLGQDIEASERVDRQTAPSEGASHIGERRVRNHRHRRRLAVPREHLILGAQRRVVPHDDGERDAVANERGELVDRHREAAVARDADAGPLPPTEGDAGSDGEALPDRRKVRSPDEVEGISHGEALDDPAHEVAGIADEHAVVREDLLQPLHDEPRVEAAPTLGGGPPLESSRVRDPPLDLLDPGTPGNGELHRVELESVE